MPFFSEIHHMFYLILIKKRLNTIKKTHKHINLYIDDVSVGQENIWIQRGSIYLNLHFEKGPAYDKYLFNILLLEKILNIIRYLVYNIRFSIRFGKSAWFYDIWYTHSNNTLNSIETNTFIYKWYNIVLKHLKYENVFGNM